MRSSTRLAHGAVHSTDLILLISIMCSNCRANAFVMQSLQNKFILTTNVLHNKKLENNVTAHMKCEKCYPRAVILQVVPHQK